MVVSADNGGGESPLKMQAPGAGKVTTPPGSRLQGGDHVNAVPPTPMRCWQRSGSSFEDVEKDLPLHDFSDCHSVLSDSEGPAGVMGLAEQASVTGLMLPPACTPQKRHFSSQFSDSHSSVSSDAVTPEGNSPLPRGQSNSHAGPAVSPPAGDRRGFVRRTDRKRSSSSAFTPMISHQLRFKNPYETYLTRHPRRVTAHASGANEGKVIDYVLYDSDLLRTVSVVRLGERGSNLPSWNCPSDHFMVGAVFRICAPSSSHRAGSGGRT